MSTQYATVEVDRRGMVAFIALNRPDKLNTWDFPGQGGLSDDFYDALAGCEDDDDVKVIVIEGRGSCFSAGHDLNTVGTVYGMGTGQPGERRASQRKRLEVDRRWFERLSRLFTCRKVTIAKVHGHCLGEGMLVAELADLCVASADAQFGHYDQRVGAAGSSIPTIPLLYCTIGLKRAHELLLTGRALPAQEALAMGLINQVVPRDELDLATLQLAERVCAMPRDGIAIGKETRHILYDALGLTTGFSVGRYSHSFFTNLRLEEGEFNLFKERRDSGTKTAFQRMSGRVEEAEWSPTVEQEQG